MPAAATHTDLSRMKPVGFLKNPSELLEKEKKTHAGDLGCERNE